MKIINKNYKINSKLNKKICLISDLHYLNKKDIKRLYYVLDSIKKTKPDYICIPGDIIDKSKIFDEDLFINWLKELSKISKIVISIGNHEFYVNKSKKIFILNYKLLNKISKINNVYLLNNKNVEIDNINFIGLTLPIQFYWNSKNNINNLMNRFDIDSKYYNILLCHSPINILKNSFNNKNINLVLCGHMHGGVVPRFLRPIFKSNGIISPSKKLFPKHAYGKLKVNDTDIIITSGIKATPYNILNIFLRPEIVIINLNNKKEKE